MGREIKFRAWDKNSKSFVDFSKAHNGILFCQGEMFISTGWDGLGNPVFDSEFDYHKRDCVFMEYAGLKNKNGVEIWEGDVYEHDDGLCEVVFQNGGFDCVFIDDREAVIPVWEIVFLGLSCVGNIYENPELLVKE